MRRPRARRGAPGRAWLAALPFMLGLVAGASALAAGGTARFETRGLDPSVEPVTDRVILRLREPGSVPDTLSLMLPSAAGGSGEARLRLVRPMSGGAHVYRLEGPATHSRIENLGSTLVAAGVALAAEPDARAHAARVPADPRFSSGEQWYLDDAYGGIAAPQAWDIATGSGEVVVAVVDSGVRPHADLTGRLLPGYDFIGDVPTANDGDGRDPDANDPGDWITQEDISSGALPSDCVPDASSWHGTLIAGLIGATANNGYGVAGVDWSAKILPVRVLGRCGGFVSDIADAIEWASGGAVPGVPPNPTPASVINLSLGGRGACGFTYGGAIAAARARGAVVVAAAGNDGGSVEGDAPANCAGVVAVAATARSGYRTDYTNTGALIAISAPGGSGDMIVLSDRGLTRAQGDTFAFESGTSLAAPLVSGVLSLMRSANLGLSGDELIAMLKASARPFPDGSCSTNECGAGILDAAGAVRAARYGGLARPSRVVFGDTSGSSPGTVILPLTNFGAPVIVSGVSVTGLHAADFAAVDLSCVGRALVGRSSCAVRLTFRPGGQGLREAELTVQTGGGSVSVPLSGWGYPAPASIFEYSVPAGGSPQYLAAGPDGSMWFTELDAGRIGRVGPNGAVSEFYLPDPGGQPFGITAGPDGNLWFTELAGDRIGRITPQGLLTAFPLPVPGSQPRGIAAGPDGALWFTLIGNGSIGRITTQGEISAFPLPGTGRSPRGIAAGPDGALWFTVEGTDEIGRLATDGGFTFYPIPTPAAKARSIVAGGDGNLWFTMLDGNKLGRVSLDGRMIEVPLVRGGSSPIDIVAGPDGNLWFSEYGSGRLGRVTPQGAVSEFLTQSTGGPTIGVAFDASGRLWYAAAGTGKVGRMTLAPRAPGADALEFYNDVLGHYFVTAGPGEIAAIDTGLAGPGWRRTGYSFRVWLYQETAPAAAVPVCRFYGTPGRGPNSHFYTASAAECDFVKQDPGWTYEGIAFFVLPPAASCPAGSQPVVRSYNNGYARNDSNHRYATSPEVQRQMAAQGWAPEDTVMCVPLD